MGWLSLHRFSRSLQSRASVESGHSLTRYFPELVDAIAAVKAKRFALDAEIIVPDGRAFSFNMLLQRVHPAASRVKRLSIRNASRADRF